MIGRWLIDYVEGRLSAADREWVESRIQADPQWRNEYDKLQKAMEWLGRQPPLHGASDLYWAGFNDRLRRRLAARTAGDRFSWRIPVAAAAVVLIALAGLWSLWSPEEKVDLAASPSVEYDSSWYDESTSYGTTLEYPASLQSDVDDLSTEEASALLSELKETVIL